MTDLIAIPPDEISRVYPLAEPHLDRAIAVSGDRYEEDEIQRDLKTGARQLWLIAGDDQIIGAVVTRIFKVGVCQIELCGGSDLKTWFHHLPKIEEWARTKGCGDCEIVGRIGWIKKCPDYELTAVILRKKL